MEEDDAESGYERVENPATTVYRNVRDMGENVSRRQVLAAAGIGLAGYLGWTTDVDGDGVSNGEELLRGRNLVGADGDEGGGPSSQDLTETLDESGETTETVTTEEEGVADLVTYLEGDTSRDDLAGYLNAIVWYDWMEGNRPTEEVKEYMQGAFERAPVTNSDGTTGICLRFIEGQKIPYQREIDPTRANEMYWDHVPVEMQPMVWYLAFVDDIKGGYGGKAQGGGVALVADMSDTESIFHDVHKNTADTALHELGHVMGGLEHKMEEPGIQDGPYTVMGDMTADTPLRYWESEWETILEETRIVTIDGYDILAQSRA